MFFGALFLLPIRARMLDNLMQNEDGGRATREGEAPAEP